MSQSTQTSDNLTKINNTDILEKTIAKSTLDSTLEKKKNKKKKKKTNSSLNKETETKGKLGSRFSKQLQLLRDQQAIQKKEEERLQKEEDECIRLQQIKEEEEAKLKEISIEKNRQSNKEKHERQLEKKKAEIRRRNMARLGLSENDFLKSTSFKSQSSMYKIKRSKPVESILSIIPEETEVIIDNDINTSDVPESWEDVCDDWETQDDQETFEEISEEAFTKIPNEILKEILKEPLQESLNESLNEPLKEELQKEELIKSPICCILGNVDAGKTTFVDKIKSTHVQKNEAGGITQKINTIFVKFNKNKYNVPGIILIDTPGHDSFYNLRSFGASLCNFVILMVDILEGLKEQTIKSIELIKNNKIPYVVVVNKIDRINLWKKQDKMSISNSLEKHQSRPTIEHYETLIHNIVNQFAEQGLNVELNYRNNDSRKYASLYPVSSRTGEGISELFMGIMKLMNNHLKQTLIWKPEFKGVLTDINIHKGLGKCMSLLVYDGTIEKKDTLVLTGINGPIIKPITKLGISDGKQFNIHDYVNATSEVHTVVKGSDEPCYVIGSPVYVISYKLNKKNTIIETNKATDLIKTYLKTKENELSKKTSKYGVLLYASSFGGLTAIMEYLEKNNIPYIDAKVGTIKKQDIAKVTSFNSTPETQIYNIVIGFDTKIDSRAEQELKTNANVTYIGDNIIYRIFDKLNETITSKQGDIKAQYQKLISWPCVLEILSHDDVYSRRDPIIMGIKVIQGVLKKGTVIQVLKQNKKKVTGQNDLCVLGHVNNIKNPKGIEIDEANIDDDVSIQINTILGESHKLYKRDFEVTTPLWSKMTSDSRYIMMKYFYNDMNPVSKFAFHTLSQIYGYERDDLESDSDDEY
jgi:small GTP-binding protein